MKNKGMGTQNLLVFNHLKVHKLLRSTDKYPNR